MARVAQPAVCPVQVPATATYRAVVVDFVCFETRLVIELDGSQHNAEVDAKREAYLRKRGYRIKRYWNSELNQYFDSVLDDIYREVTARPLTRPQGER